MYRYGKQKPATGHLPGLNNDLSLKLYRGMLRIRLVQERIAAEYHKDEMKTPVHLYIGQEAIAIGVCAVLHTDDLLFSNHRSHGHYLAKGGNLDRMIAELHCRETGCSKGRGGSMHLVDQAVGLVGSSSIVGGGIPLGTGAAFAGKMRDSGELSTIFFGDGAADEGVLFESMNFATLKKLPLLYVCENNFYSVCSPLHQRTSTPIYKRAEAFDIPARLVDGTDVEAVFHAAHEAVEHIRRGGGPYFLEIRAYRWRGHGGAQEDFTLGYRSKEELEDWKEQCPLSKYEEHLLHRKVLDDKTICQMRGEISAEIEDAFSFAHQSPFPAKETLLNYVYQE